MAIAQTGEIGEAVERSFRKLLADKPYRSITVSDICEKAHLSRKSFYSYYSNKEDIVSVIFRRDVIDPLERINTMFAHQEVRNMGALIYIKMYQSLYENREFYTHLVKPLGLGGEVFIRVATSAIYDYNIPLIASLKIAENEQQADYIAYFFASSQAMLMHKWITDGAKISVEELATLYLKMTESFWISSSDNMQ